MPLKIKYPKCSRKAFNERRCSSLKAISFMKGSKKKTLYFKTVKEREDYYKKKLKSKYTKFSRYSPLHFDKSKKKTVYKSRVKRKSRKSRKSRNKRSKRSKRSKR